MATLEKRIETLESLCSNRPLSRLSSAELDARIVSLLGYLPNAEESAALLKQLRAGKGLAGINGIA